LGQIGKAFGFYAGEYNDHFPYACQFPWHGRPDNPYYLPNLQVLMENYFPRSEEFICVNRPWARGERAALNQPWKRAPIWGCPNDQYNDYCYQNYGSNYLYISEWLGGVATRENPWWKRNFCYHRVSEVGDPSWVMLMSDIRAGNLPRPHGNGMKINILCVDGHAELFDFVSSNIGQWNFETMSRWVE
jgi:prepilin-type processing-associated H-X9-DG protein